jgi:hypothetical protein
VTVILEQQSSEYIPAQTSGSDVKGPKYMEHLVQDGKVTWAIKPAIGVSHDLTFKFLISKIQHLVSKIIILLSRKTQDCLYLLWGPLLDLRASIHLQVATPIYTSVFLSPIDDIASGEQAPVPVPDVNRRY